MGPQPWLFGSRPRKSPGAKRIGGSRGRTLRPNRSDTSRLFGNAAADSDPNPSSWGP